MRQHRKTRLIHREQHNAILSNTPETGSTTLNGLNGLNASVQQHYLSFNTRVHID